MNRLPQGKKEEALTRREGCLRWEGCLRNENTQAQMRTEKETEMWNNKNLKWIRENGPAFICKPRGKGPGQGPQGSFYRTPSKDTVLGCALKENLVNELGNRRFQMKLRNCRLPSTKKSPVCSLLLVVTSKGSRMWLDFLEPLSLSLLSKRQCYLP